MQRLQQDELREALSPVHPSNLLDPQTVLQVDQTALADQGVLRPLHYRSRAELEKIERSDADIAKYLYRKAPASAETPSQNKAQS